MALKEEGGAILLCQLQRIVFVGLVAAIPSLGQRPGLLAKRAVMPPVILHTELVIVEKIAQVIIADAHAAQIPYSVDKYRNFLCA